MSESPNTGIAHEWKDKFGDGHRLVHTDITWIKRHEQLNHARPQGGWTPDNYQSGPVNLELAKVAAKNQRLREIVNEITLEPTFEDKRLSFVDIQMDRDAWLKLKALRGGGE